MELTDLEPFSAYRWQGQQVDYLEPQGRTVVITNPKPDAAKGGVQ